MKKNIFLFLIITILAIFNFSNTNALSTNSTFNIVGPYNSSYECNKTLKENSNKTEGEYSKYERSKCYSNNGKYQYNICKKGEGCVNTSSNIKQKDIVSVKPIYNTKNPYANKTITIKGKKGTFESIFGNKIASLIKKIVGNSKKSDAVKKLNYLNNKLIKIGNKEKFKNNKLVQDLIGYIKFEVSEEIVILKKQIAIEEENEGLDDFICELEGGCEESQVMCTAEYAPVCATKSPCPADAMCISKGTEKTYSNICKANADKAVVLYKGKCKENTKPNICTREYRPVCAQPPMPTCPKGAMCKMSMPSLKTYSNSCMAKAAGAKNIVNGKCGPNSIQ